MFRMERRLPLLVVLAVVLLAATPALGDPGDNKDRVDAQLGAAQDRLDAAQAQEGVLTEELSALTARARAATAAVDTEQGRLDALEIALAEQRGVRERIEADLRDLVERLRLAQHEEIVAMDRLEQRVRQMYMAADPDVVSLLFGATSFSELIENIDLLNRIGRQDKQIAAAAKAARAHTARATSQVRNARRQAVRAERVLAERTAEQRAVRDRLAASRDDVSAAERAKRGALGEIRATEANLHDEVEALAAESASLAATIRGASSGTSASAPSASGLIWPVSGPVTSGFGPRGGRMHEGIDIAVPEGTPVVAAASGTVIYAGWLGGYGNLVVVDHGGGLSTAYAHNSGFATSVGARVAQGDVVSYSGNTGHSTGPHVHFEVRVNGTAVDPLGYLSGAGPCPARPPPVTRR